MDSLDFFRRNLKPIMAALTLMAMITFVFDDSMRGNNPTMIPFLLAILFGGGAFVWGTRKGKQNEYLAMGALFGAVLGLAVIVFGERESSEQPAIAGLKQRDIANLKSRRETANRIVGLIYRKSHPIPEQFAKGKLSVCPETLAWINSPFSTAGTTVPWPLMSERLVITSKSPPPGAGDVVALISPPAKVSSPKPFSACSTCG